jgi:hypothetical protein
MGGLVRRRDTIVPTNSKKIDLIPGLIVFAGRLLVHRLLNPLGFAVGQLAVFQGASEAPLSAS